MKKAIIFLIIFAFYKGIGQCNAPSNLNLTILNATSNQLSWTENGAVNTWETIVVPDFYVGATLPSNGFTATTNNPFIFTDLPILSGCNVFFVRSVCSATDVSPWVAIGSSGCSNNIYNYLTTLSNDSFLLNDKSGLQLFPNPAKNLIQIKLNSKIDEITLFDSQGKVILIQTQNNNEINIEKLSKGVYIIDVLIENENFYRKFIKE